MKKEQRHFWQYEELQALYHLPILELVYRAATVHRTHFDPRVLQLSTLLNIKTGACPEDCAYCPQSAHYDTQLKSEPIMDLPSILQAVQKAKAQGATRFCMGAAWRRPPKKDLPKILQIIQALKKEGMESCMTLGLLSREEAEKLKTAGLDYYNHNIDSSPEFYSKIISTRKFTDRLETLENVRAAGMKVCSGGIVGMGESPEDRLRFLLTLANLSEYPESVPINRLVPIPGTPLENAKPLEDIEFLRMIALARILMPKAYLRLSAGRASMDQSMQMLCFLSGANSVHFGEKLLITANVEVTEDQQFFASLGFNPSKKFSTQTKKTIPLKVQNADAS